ncbi:unnamed protein product [Linum trigynum]|uniref:Uncharacterized protein n=1 Tax=Linum trigynum TaxID=586398 RepID=A0AAV2E1K5_9ROSI
MSLSSLSLTDTFSEPSNGSFSVPTAGTPSALAKSFLVTISSINVLPHPPFLLRDDGSSTNPGAGKILLQIDVWKPPDGGNKGSTSLNRGRRRKWKIAQAKGNGNYYSARYNGYYRSDDKIESGKGSQPPSDAAPKGMGQYRGSSVQFFGEGTYGSHRICGRLSFNGRIRREVEGNEGIESLGRALLQPMTRIGGRKRGALSQEPLQQRGRNRGRERSVKRSIMNALTGEVNTTNKRGLKTTNRGVAIKRAEKLTYEGEAIKKPRKGGEVHMLI